MNNNFKQNLSSYLVLFGGLSIGFFFFTYFSYNRQLQLTTGILMSIFYLGWGIVYHSLKKSLTLKVVIEYLLISMLALAILSTLLIRT